MRLQQAGKNASGQTHYLSLSGFELYGTVLAAVEEPLGSFLFTTFNLISTRKELVWCIFNRLSDYLPRGQAEQLLQF